jgi:hypothetical protein
MIDAATRLQGVEQLIDRNQYFVIHAARQSGKTTCLQDLAQRLNEGGQYYTLYCSLEGIQRVVDPKDGIPAIVKTIRNSLEFATNIPHHREFAKEADFEDFTGVLQVSLARFCMLLDKPLVILFDEADCLSESTLVLFLRQLRDGYNNRFYRPFIHSVALVGMRNIRDYKARVRPDTESLGGVSPFNIVTEALTLRNFTKEEIIRLYRQHTGETGQVFEDAAISMVWEQTQGQPWLVNAIAREVIEKMLHADYAKPVTAALVSEAIQTIILRRDTHIDSLLERLKEERVRKVIEPIIMGENFAGRLSDDFLYVRDMGLITETKERLEPANPIYGEVIARTLSYDAQQNLSQNYATYQMPRYLKDGRIDMDYLLRDFQQFWRENSDVWIEKFDYKEAAPHLVLMAFLQRVINGGGQIIREMAAGRGRIDLCLIYENRKYPVELKIRYGEKYLEEGLTQTARYMDTCGCAEGWLAVFDRRPGLKWEDKIYMKKETVGEKTVTVVGL